MTVSQENGVVADNSRAKAAKESQRYGLSRYGGEGR